MQHLIKLYPEAVEALRLYFLEIMLNSLENGSLPENFKEYARERGVPIENVISMLESNPRATFDFFDENEIFIQITGDDVLGWKWEITGISPQNMIFDTRKNAEKEAIQESFKLLNEQLCLTKS